MNNEIIKKIKQPITNKDMVGYFTKNLYTYIFYFVNSNIVVGHIVSYIVSYNNYLAIIYLLIIYIFICTSHIWNFM